MRYLIVIHKDPDSDYGVTVPDLPGCFSAGQTLDEAIANAKESIECHLEGLLLDRSIIPLSRPLSEHEQNIEYAEALWLLIPIQRNQTVERTAEVTFEIEPSLIASTRNSVSKSKLSFWTTSP